MSQGKGYTLISTDAAGRSAVPTSQGAVVGNLVFTSGHGPLDVGTHTISAKTFEEQVVRTIENIQTVLEAAGTSLQNCIKVEVILRRFEDFEEFNRIYRSYFDQPYPPRMAFISTLVREDVDVEMSAIAVIPDQEA